MSKVNEKINAALDHNLAEFMEHGPGLRKTTQTAVAAKCPTGKHILICGLGGMGVGQMWIWTRPYGQLDGEIDPRAADVWDELPVQPCCNFGISDACVS